MYFFPTVASPLCYVMLHNASQDTGATELWENILVINQTQRNKPESNKTKKATRTAIMYEEIFSIH